MAPRARKPHPSTLARAARIGVLLDELYPAPPIPLEHETPFQLLIAVMLSAQTTDKKVNEVTPALFALGRTPAELARVPVESIQRAIAQLGLAPTKAKNVKRACEILALDHGGVVPSEEAALERLPGVGHKTASVVRAQAFGLPAFPIDTHIHRLAQRWRLTSGKNVEQTERDLKALYPPELWAKRHLQIIYFGREHCPALRHEPARCPVCSWAGKATSSGSARTRSS